MEKENYHFFWGGPLSNFYTCYFTDSEGITYCSSEQYYMAKKALFFNDTFRYKKIMEETNPKKIKNHGRAVEGYSDELWYGPEDGETEDNPAKKAMYEAVKYKFTQNEKLLNILKDTEGQTLVEASPFDKRWGIGMRGDQISAKYKRFWNGKNWLGYILTQLRDEILEKERRSQLW